MLEPKAYADELRASGVRLDCLNMTGGVPDPRAVFKLRSLIRDFRPDVVHSHMVHANLLARFTRLFTGAMPVLLSTAHNTNEGGRLLMLMYRLTDRLCELTTNVSEDAVESFVRQKAAPKNRIRFMPNGINLANFRRDPGEGQAMRDELGLGGAFVWLAIGRFVEAKDYPTMLRAWARVVAARDDGRLLIAGDGPEREAAERIAAELGISDKVRFLGVRKDVSRLMNAADAYVMSSRWEGMPLVLLEASASELPIVATDAGGNREVVADGETGYLTRPANDALLAGKMAEMMALSPAERANMGSIARDRVIGKYDLDAVVAGWESLYAQQKAFKRSGFTERREYS